MIRWPLNCDGPRRPSQARIVGLGFAVNRREGYYRIPTAPAITGLVKTEPPAGVVFISAIDADEEDLRLLDQAR